MDIQKILTELGIKNENNGVYTTEWVQGGDHLFNSMTPVDGSVIAKIHSPNEKQYEQAISVAQDTFQKWRTVPAPQRGQLVREIGDALREKKEALGMLISYEMGKIKSEGLGEVQEAIDVADFAVGLSRQLYGKSMHSERPQHRMYEQWHPLGPVGVISAFNFPVAVWAWNAMIAAVCGDTVIWKPSEQTPLCAIATQNICNEVTTRWGYPGLFTLLCGDGPKIGEALANDRRVPLISATGSTRMGRSVAQAVAARLGKSILELGGNNALIVMDDADLNLAVPAILFGAVGTAGQRCTTTRRVLVHKDIEGKLTRALVDGYKQVRIGSPLDDATLMGPASNQAAVDQFLSAIKVVATEGGEVLCGGKVKKDMPSDLYLEPAIAKVPKDFSLLKEETFAPLVYLVSIDSLEDAISFNNDVPQGLSSAIFTESLKNAEQFLSHWGSDCGIANVNIGTSGAEIGGAFGGEKDTGGGRESGSDSWKQYMRRQTNTINFSDEMPLAQGVSFKL